MTSVTVATRVDELLRGVPEWAELAADTAEPNVFYEPFVLLPAMEQLALGSDVRILFIRSDDDRLIGVVPLERHRWSLAIPSPHFSMWRHRYCFLSTPILRSGFADAAVAALFGWLDAAGGAGRFLQLPGHVGGGAFDRAVEASCGENNRFLRTTGGYDRPFVVAGLPPARYLEATVPAKRRSELRRKRKRLGDLGEVAVVGASTQAELDLWLPRFLQLEDRGWKGEAGTSIASGAKDRAFLQAVARRNGERHRLELLALTLNGAPIAMAISLRSAGAVFAFKIAYDEDYSAYSPGVQVELEVLQRLLADPTTTWADSCAASDYAAAPSTLWAERRVIREAELVHASRFGRGLVAIGAPLQGLAAATRAWMRGLPPSVQRPLRQLGAALRG
ncbi:MAG: GNAT family N-acetyltransferase [Pseudomonadota bacterium]|nr:GNAT family N-acetyltransferase [Pseudomonadota bacterium]